MRNDQAHGAARAGWIALAAGAALLAVSMGVRHGFGLFMQPMTLTHGWGRETYSLAMAAQNLIWGLAQPFAGAVADRWGAGRTILGGTLLYAAGLVLMAESESVALFYLGAALFLGLGLSGCTFAVVFGAVSRSLPADKRSQAMGIASAVGSFGQFAALPIEAQLIDALGWSAALLALAATLGVSAALALPLWEGRRADAAPADGLSTKAALRAALGDRDFRLLSFGYFVCGFQVIFIAIHLPAYLGEAGFPGVVAATGLALIGLFNVFGSYGFGQLGARWSKTRLLAVIYAVRAVAILGFLALPLTETSVYAFSVVMGLSWLSTVPLTSGWVAERYGARSLSMLGGLVFLAHQVGAFLGVWLGGAARDRLGSYDVVWLGAVALSVVAVTANLLIRPQASGRPPAVAAEATA